MSRRASRPRRSGVAWPDLTAESPPADAASARPILPRPGTGAKLTIGLGAVLTLVALIAKGGTSLGPMTLVEIAVTLLGVGVAAAAALAAPTPQRSWGGVTLLAVAALTVWTAVSVIWSVVPDVSWADANRAIAYLFAFAGAIGLARLWPWRAGAVLGAVLVAASAISVIALALKSFPVAFNSTEELARLREPLDYWNALGLMAAFAVPPCLWLGARREGPPALRALAWPLLGLAGVVVALSYSRGVLIALVVGGAFWFAVVPLRLRGLAVLLAGSAGAAAVSVWAFADDALSKDRAPLTQRVDAGEQLALFCVLMVAVLFVAGLVVNRRADRRPLSDRWRERIGLGALGVGAGALVAGAIALSVTGGGPGARLDRAWDNFFSTNKASTTYGPSRLKSIGTRRGSYWNDAEEVWSHHKVLGVGADGYAVARKRYREDPVEVTHAHGYVPQTAADLGLVGLGLSLLALVAWIAAAARSCGSRRRLRLAQLDPRRLPAALGRTGERLARVPAALGRAPAGLSARADRAAARRPVDADRIALLTLATVVLTFGVHSLIDWTWFVPGTALVAARVRRLRRRPRAARGARARAHAPGRQPGGHRARARGTGARRRLDDLAAVALGQGVRRRSGRSRGRPAERCPRGGPGGAQAQPARPAAAVRPLDDRGRGPAPRPRAEGARGGRATPAQQPGGVDAARLLPAQRAPAGDAGLPVRARGALPRSQVARHPEPAARRLPPPAPQAGEREVERGEPGPGRRPRRDREAGQAGEGQVTRALSGLIAAAAAIVLAAPAQASTTQEATFQDDAMLVYPTRAEVGKTLDILQGLGVDRVRVTVYWRLVAPDAQSSRKPSFSGGGAADPAAYPKANWKRYDDLVRLAYDRGIAVNFDVAGPAPDWASSGLGGYANPSASEFGPFAAAVAARYTGTYTPPPGEQNPPPPPPRNPSPLPPLPLPGLDGASAQQQGQVSADDNTGTLPRVNYWSFFNEPNQRTFLMPQYVDRKEASPRIYRALLDAGWASLQGTGHGRDTVIIGDTAPKGGGERDDAANMRPLRFVRALYCVNSKLRPLGGATARALGCPDSNQVRDFPRQHPALFAASGFAHHPYSLLTPPALPSRNRDDVGMGDLGRLTSTLRRIFSSYRVRGGLPVYNTEFGYQSRPPDPFGFSQPLQAAYINQAEFLSYVNPNVRSTNQFLLEDSAPYTQFPPNSFQYWSSFQTGLLERGGGLKQAFGAYRIPIFIPGARRFFPATFRVWGAARPAPNGSAQSVQVQFRGNARGAKWRTMKTARTRNARNYVDTRVRLSRSGTVRLRWRAPNGGVLFSRAAGVRIG